MSALNIPGYREAHETVDSRLIDAQGLTFALEQMMLLHPTLNVADDEKAQALFALARAIRENIVSAISFQDVAWETLKHPNMQAA